MKTSQDKASVILTPSKKCWIWNNIKRFYDRDSYFSHFYSEIILADFKEILAKARTVDGLLELLTATSYNQNIQFWRKDNQYFTYPSLGFQIKSLLQIWNEILTVRNKNYESLLWNNLEEDSASEEDSEDILQTPQEDEIVQAPHASAARQFVQRKCFGQVPNQLSHWSLKFSIGKYQYASIQKRVISKSTCVKRDFSTEYSKFKKEICQTAKNTVSNSEVGLFIQSDIKSFFHKIKIIDMIDFLKRKFSTESTNSVAILQELLLNLAGSAKENDTLPLGWIFSGFCADLICQEIHIKRHLITAKVKERIFNECAISISAIEIINYVDDFIFVVQFKDKLKESDIKDEIQHSITQAILCECESVFKKTLPTSEINFHPFNSAKTKCHKLTEDFLRILDSNLFHFEIQASLDQDDMPQRWTLIDDLLLPCDNQINLNERVQFYENLKNLRAKIEADEVRSDEDFKEYLDKILFKLNTDGDKYISTICSVLFSYLASKRINTEIAPPTSESLNDHTLTLIDALSKRRRSVNTWIKFLSAFKIHVEEGNSPEEIKVFINHLNRIFYNIKSYLGTDSCNIDDLKLLATWIYKLRSSIPEAKELYDSLLMDDTSNFHPLIQFKKNHNALEIIKLNKLEEVTELSPIHFGIALIDCKPPFCLDLLRSYFQKTQQSDSIKLFIEEFSYRILPQMDKASLSQFEELIPSNLKYLSVAREIRIQSQNYLKNYQLFQYLPQRFNKWITRINKNPYRFLQAISLEEHFSSIFLTEKQRPYVFYQEIIGLFLIMSSRYEEFLKILFFQYTSFESVNFLSWKATPTSLSPLAFQVLEPLSKILNLQTLDLRKKVTLPLTDLGDLYFPFEIKYSKENEINFVHFPFDKFIESYFKKYNFSQGMKIVMAPIGFKPVTENGIITKRLLPEQEYNLSNLSTKRPIQKTLSIRSLHAKITHALNYAIKQKAHLIIFPELTLPEKHLLGYLNKAGQNGLILIAGLEYSKTPENKSINETIISFPTKRSLNPFGKSYIPLKQIKNYAGAREICDLKNNYFTPIPHIIYIFESLKFCNFSILTCSDFLSLKIKTGLQGKIQTLFVPSMNYDSTTYHHVAQSCIRELYCYCIICNNKYFGRSSIFWPRRKEYDRTVFSIEGKNSKPDFCMVEITPAIIKEIQEKNPDIPFEDVEDLKEFKQLPPDWKKKG